MVMVGYILKSTSCVTTCGHQAKVGWCTLGYYKLSQAVQRPNETCYAFGCLPLVPPGVVGSGRRRLVYDWEGTIESDVRGAYRDN